MSKATEGPTSARLSRRNMIVGGAMIAASGIAWARQPTAAAPLLGSAKLDAVVPKRIGDWQFETASGLVLPPPDQMRDEIYSDLLTRVYQHPDGAAVMFLVAYSGSQDGMIQVHRPEVCYPASGYRLVQNDAGTLALATREVPARFIVAEGTGRNEQLAYWTRVGGAFPTSWAGQRVAVIEENLRGRIPDGVLVRISTNAIEDRDGFATIERFAADLQRSLPPRGSAALLGVA